MGKSSAPPAPDYIGAAKETAAQNRVNQYTPYGSLTYSKNPGQFDQAGYDTAMARFNETGQSPVVDANPYLPWLQNREDGGPTGATTGIAPRREDYTTDNDTYSQTVNLTPQAQATLDKQMALSDKYADTANIGFDKTRELFENPQLDESLLPKRAIDVGQTAQQAIMARLQPQLAQNEEAMRSRLANQGIGLGSTAYGRESTIAGQQRNDLELQAALKGIGLDDANRKSALEEQAYLQDRPLNLINALRTGAQVQNPQFAAVPQGADILGATKAGYDASLDAYNADAASSGGLMSGLLGLGLGIGGLGVGGGSTLGGKALGGLFGIK